MGSLAAATPASGTESGFWNVPPSVIWSSGWWLWPGTVPSFGTHLNGTNPQKPPRASQVWNLACVTPSSAVPGVVTSGAQGSPSLSRDFRVCAWAWPWRNGSDRMGKTLGSTELTC